MSIVSSWTILLSLKFVSIRVTNRQSLYHQKRLTGILGINQKSTYIFRTFRTQRLFSITIRAHSSLGSISSMLCEPAADWNHPLSLSRCPTVQSVQHSHDSTAPVPEQSTYLLQGKAGETGACSKTVQQLHRSRSGVAVSSKNGMVIKSCAEVTLLQHPP